MRTPIGNIGRFLGTFDPNAPVVLPGQQVAAPVAAPAVLPPVAAAPVALPPPVAAAPAPVAAAPVDAPPVAAPPVVLPAAALNQILGAVANGQQQAAQDLATARAAQAQAQFQAPAPVPAPETRTQQLDQLLTKVDALTNRAEAAELESYRQGAIRHAQGGGLEMVESMVFGTTPTEIDTSISVAAAEYRLIAGRVAQNIQQQMQQQMQQQAAPTNGVPAQQPHTQAVVGAVGGQPVTAPQPPMQGQQQTVSGPSMVQVPGVPDAQPNQPYTPEMISYLTSEGIRTGEYAQHREQLQRQLRGQLSGPGQGWSFSSQSQQLSPPVPQSAPAAAPAVQHQMYAGMSMPQVQTAPVHAAPGTLLPPQHAPQPHPAVAQHPMHQHQMAAGGFAPQPVHLDGGAPFDTNAARFAAQNSVAQARMRAGFGPPNPFNSQ